MKNVLDCVATPQGEVNLFGHIAPGFEPVLHAFRENFTKGAELGAACSAYVNGERVVDIWGGWRCLNHQKPWDEDTMVVVMSTTKGLTALAMALLHADGQLDFDRTVASYWPEFAQGGKSSVTVRQLLAHQAGLAAVDVPLTPKSMADRQTLEDVLAKQVPLWVPGTRHGYHATTLGFYQNAIIRRADQQGRTVGELVRDRLSGTPPNDMYIGLPDAIPDARVAKIAVGPDWRAMRQLPLRTILSSLNPRSLFHRVAANPKLKKLSDVSTRQYLKLELPSFGCVATARALALTYSLFAGRNPILQGTSETFCQLEASAIQPSNDGTDIVLGIPTAYSLGFSKPSPFFNFGSDDRAYGTPGAGGSQAFADPATHLGFAYTPNNLRLGVLDDQRARVLREATYQCIEKLS
ncbi:serine hydrolase domain-containing protein [Emcibacter sp.]|uniref:serine hydrolase domain-containing protein n=1 Tax=Emcibacter sp. TaxID=1979954 RepID=UPI003A8D0A6E